MSSQWPFVSSGHLVLSWVARPLSCLNEASHSLPWQPPFNTLLTTEPTKGGPHFIQVSHTRCAQSCFMLSLIVVGALQRAVVSPSDLSRGATCCRCASRCGSPLLEDHFAPDGPLSSDSNLPRVCAIDFFSLPAFVGSLLLSVMLLHVTIALVILLFSSLVLTLLFPHCCIF